MSLEMGVDKLNWTETVLVERVLEVEPGVEVKRLADGSLQVKGARICYQLYQRKMETILAILVMDYVVKGNYGTVVKVELMVIGDRQLVREMVNWFRTGKIG